MLDKRGEKAAREVIDAAFEVHRALGPGLLESAYQACLAHELTQRSVEWEREVALPVEYKGWKVEAGYRLDLVVEKSVIVELKAVDRLQPLHEAQLLSYLRLTGRRIGLLINFNTRYLKDGIKRLVNGY